MKIRRTLVAAMAAAAFSAASANADLFETEPNNTFATANEIVRGDPN